MFVRISATDWVDNGWDLAQSIAFAERLRETGVDLIDYSSGGMVTDAEIPAGPGFQVPFPGICVRGVPAVAHDLCGDRGCRQLKNVGSFLNRTAQGAGPDLFNCGSVRT